ncbi:alpha-L-rhamnosidase C-terminal domain-containing protein [Streptomyces sp. NPDC048278]|uniref:alpha-L-rhamnosidase C-terminal domain-containing protein n=1 Tax=Streptomyces sp. NPDC048278 TaxID=3155809 RepID=UPI003421CDA0
MPRGGGPSGRHAVVAVFGPDSPGFRHFLLQPHIDPTGRITRVAGSYESPYGESGGSRTAARRSPTKGGSQTCPRSRPGCSRDLRLSMSVGLSGAFE